LKIEAAFSFVVAVVLLVVVAAWHVLKVVLKSSQLKVCSKICYTFFVLRPFCLNKSNNVWDLFVVVVVVVVVVSCCCCGCCSIWFHNIL